MVTSCEAYAPQRKRLECCAPLASEHHRHQLTAVSRPMGGLDVVEGFCHLAAWQQPMPAAACICLSSAPNASGIMIMHAAEALLWQLHSSTVW